MRRPEQGWSGCGQRRQLEKVPPVLIDRFVFRFLVFCPG
ncbi:hypothetical protein ppKF707_2855 [Metapseudomonas furukawaii]|nr:hypothetical protein ppKF707_2855 [Pseudomonas furukawaii]